MTDRMAERNLLQGNALYKLFEIQINNENSLTTLELFEELEKTDIAKSFIKYLGDKNLKTSFRAVLSFLSIYCVNNKTLEKIERKYWKITELGKKLFYFTEGKADVFYKLIFVKTKEELEEMISNNLTKIDKQIGNIQIKEDKLTQLEKNIEKNTDKNILDSKTILMDKLKHIDKRGDLFEEMCAILLKQLGYIIEDVASKEGADGGIDIVVKQDLLALNGRIIIQCKRYSDNPVQASVVREVSGLLNKGKDKNGCIITSNRFTSEAKKEAKHLGITLIDGEMFVELWCSMYEKMNEEEKALFPIKQIWVYDDKNKIDNDG